MMNPRKIAKSLVTMLPRSVLYEMFYQSGRALGVKSYEVSGEAGAFFGPIYDQAVTKSYLNTGRWSDNIVRMFVRYFEADGGTFYDVGANIGLVSMPLAKNSGVKVVAFEPDAHNCALLRANVAVAGVPVRVVNAAVGREKGTLRFARSEYNSGDHHIAADGELSVEVVPLDDYPPGPGCFAVKIDTQGAEPMIIQGGEKVLSQAGLIVLEFWPWGMRRMGTNPQPILDFAAKHFKRGMVLRHDQPAGEAIPIDEVLSQLRSVMAAGGEYDAADLVLCERL